MRLGHAIDDVCPDCGLFSQTVSHLFECPAHPTTLDTRSLWERPRDAVDHIRSFSSFDLPPLGTPPRPSRRRRPPRAPPDPPDDLFSPLTLPPTQRSSQSPPRIRPLMPVRGFSSSSSSLFSTPLRRRSSSSSSSQSEINSDSDLFL